MKLIVDEQSDALYLRLDDSDVVDSTETAPGVILDYNAQDQVVGIEILRLSSRCPAMNLRELIFQQGPAA